MSGGVKIPGRREYVVEAVGSAVTDRASLPGDNVARLCGVECHCEPRFHGPALYSGRNVLTRAESHVGLTLSGVLLPASGELEFDPRPALRVQIGPLGGRMRRTGAN